MIAVKTTAILALACAAAAALRHRSASLRHAVLAAGFAAAALLPVIELVAPGWGLSVAPALPPLAAVDAGERRMFWILWMAGVVLGVATLASGLARIAWLRAAARREVIDSWRTIADQAACEFGIRRPVALFETDRAPLAVTWGLLRPKIMLPRSARSWSDDCLRAVLRHELAHVRRGDWAVQLLVATVTRLFWVNPLVWIAARWLRAESERACDDAVLNLGVDAADYSAQLIAVARTLKGDHAAKRAATVAPGAAAASGFARRIAAALDPRLDRTPLSPCAAVLIAATLTAAALPIAGFGRAPSVDAPSLLIVQRDVLRRFGGEERRFSIVARDVSFWRTRIEGRVELQARLNIDGSVSGVRIVEPVHPDLASAAAVIVRHWRREPARVRGVPVEIPIRMTVDFRRER